MSPVPLHYTVDGPADAAFSSDGGRGAPVLLLGSPLGTTGAIWQAQLPALTQRLRVVRYDHRGHGGSPLPPGPYELADLGRDLLALVDSLGAQQVYLGGLSLGSMVALWVAAHHPSRVSRLVLAGTAAALGPPESWRSRAETVRAQGMAAVASTVVDRWLPAPFAAAHPDVRQALLDEVLATPAEGYARCCGALETMDLGPELGRVSAPTLVVIGGEDPSTPPELGRAVAAGIPEAQVVEIAGAAHLSPISHSDEFARLLTEFLA